ncbi:MAG: hypothetical protein ACXADW_03630 [Candidatus Hodarchaeales archaeon]|jgi:hypothetical protein
MTSVVFLDSVSQKFPSLLAKEHFHAPMIKPGLFGFPRGAGYQENVEER